MTNRFFAILRYTMATAMIASAFVFSGCDSDDDATPVTFDGSIYAFISQDKFKQANSKDPDTALDSLVMYIDKFPDLKTTLQSTAELTLFAPSNTAFKNLTALPGLADPDKVNQDIIKAVLAYHIVPGKKTSADMTAGATLATSYSVGGTADVIKVNEGGTLLTGSSNDKIVIHTKDQLTTNGVVHTTETVLIPNAIGAQLKSILGSLAASVLLGSDFTLMAYFINLSESGATAETSITATLANPNAKLTLLAVPNTVFQLAVGEGNMASEADVKEWMQSFTPAEARAVLRNHILTKQYTVAGSDDDAIETFKNNGIMSPDLLSHTDDPDNSMVSLTGIPAGDCQCPTGVVIVYNPGGQQAPILVPDLDTEIGVNNGVLQVIGGIFLN